MATAQICPVVGSTTSVLPPDHPQYDASQPGLVCPVTKASTDHHHNLSPHPTTPGATINNELTKIKSPSATACPALKNANKGKSLTDATCPVVGPVSAYLPVGHPNPEDAKDGAVCPITNATLKHHEGKVEVHPEVVKKEGVCPVTHKTAAEAEKIEAEAEAEAKA